MESYYFSATANSHLLRKLARVGGGAFEAFDTQIKSKWLSKVQRQLRKTAERGLVDVSVDWQLFDNDAPRPLQAPSQISSVFSGSRQVS